VRKLQSLLNSTGASLATDGLFGGETEEAVIAFQRARGLDRDGVVGPYTWRALLGDLAHEEESGSIRGAEDPVMQAQLEEARQYRAFIEAGADLAGVDVAIVLGIGSRESHWGLLLDPVGPAGTGDTIARPTPKPWRAGPMPPDGGGFGRGLMQIDFDAHPFARGDEWRDAEKNIAYGCKVLKQNLVYLAARRQLTRDTLLRAALAAYNCGAGNVIKALERNRDVDYYTHGRDYSRDTLDRARWFAEHT
jgi:hypothetical protein